MGMVKHHPSLFHSCKGVANLYLPAPNRLHFGSSQYDSRLESLAYKEIPVDLFVSNLSVAEFPVSLFAQWKFVRLCLPSGVSRTLVTDESGHRRARRPDQTTPTALILPHKSADYY